MLTLPGQSIPSGTQLLRGDSPAGCLGSHQPPTLPCLHSWGSAKPPGLPAHLPGTGQQGQGLISHMQSSAGVAAERAQSTKPCLMPTREPLIWGVQQCQGLLCLDFRLPCSSKAPEMRRPWVPAGQWAKRPQSPSGWVTKAIRGHASTQGLAQPAGLVTEGRAGWMPGLDGCQQWELPPALSPGQLKHHSKAQQTPRGKVHPGLSCWLRCSSPSSITN